VDVKSGTGSDLFFMDRSNSTLSHDEEGLYSQASHSHENQTSTAARPTIGRC